METKCIYSFFRAFLRFFILILVIIPAVASADEPAKVVINYIEANQAENYSGNLVSAYITLIYKDSSPIESPDISMFKVLEDGSFMDITSISTSSEPMSLVLALDTSGSMMARDNIGKTSMDYAKEAAVEFIAMLDKNDRVAVYSFNNDTNHHLDFTDNHAEAIKVIKSLDSKYKAATRLYDTIIDAIKKASEIPRGRRAIIILTDGKDEKGGTTCSIHNSNDVIDAASTKTIRVPIYTIGVGPKVDAKELGRISGFTGGLSMLAKDTSELSLFYRKLAEQLKKQILIEYITRAPSGEHSLVVKVSGDNIQAQDEKRFWSPPLPVLNPPRVTILETVKSEDNNSLFNVKLEITNQETVKKVRYYVDSVLKDELSTPPFKGFKWDTSGLKSGLHVLKVEAVQVNGQSAYGETTVRIGSGNDSDSPLSGDPDESGLSGNIYFPVSVILLIVVIAVILLCKRNKKKTPAPESVTKIQPVKVNVSEKPAISTWNEAPPDNSDNEATMMDMQAAAEPLAKLTVIKSQKLDLGATFKVLGTTTIGRGTDNDIRIPDKPVSRKHSIINYAGGNFHIRDLNSSYGTKMDGNDVTPGGTVLKDGAKIQFGTGTVMEFTILISPSGPGAPSEDDDDKTMIYNND